MSFALDSAVSLTKVLEQGEMKITAFEKNATTGKFDFAVKIEGVNAGTGATAENLGKVFGLEGATEVDGDYSVDNMVFTLINRERYLQNTSKASRGATGTPWNAMSSRDVSRSARHGLAVLQVPLEKGGD